MEECSIDTPLEGLELNYVAENLGPFEWRKLGLYLGIPEPRLANWERQFMMNTEQAAVQMLNTWHNNQIPQEERGYLMKALENCKLRNLADKIRRGEYRHRRPAGMMPIPPPNLNNYNHPMQQQAQVPHRQLGCPIAGPHYGMKAEPMDTTGTTAKHEISEILLRDLARKLGAEWRTLGTYLGFETAEIQQIIEQHHHQVKECIFQMLYQWRSKAGVNATKAKLKKALERSERLDLVDYVDNPDD